MFKITSDEGTKWYAYDKAVILLMRYGWQVTSCQAVLKAMTVMGPEFYRGQP